MSAVWLPCPHCGGKLPQLNRGTFLGCSIYMFDNFAVEGGGGLAELILQNFPDLREELSWAVYIHV